MHIVTYLGISAALLLRKKVNNSDSGPISIVRIKMGGNDNKA